jgi:Selenoprotein, putative
VSARAWLRVFWRRLREWSGDAAYDTYVARAGGGEVLDREAFYLDSLRRRYERPSRCC